MDIWMQICCFCKNHQTQKPKNSKSELSGSKSANLKIDLFDSFEPTMSDDVPGADVEADALGVVGAEFDVVMREIAELDDTKRPLTKKIGKFKREVNKVMKRKFADLRVQDPDATTVTMNVGSVTFVLEEVTACAACKVDVMDAFFDSENIEKYKAAVEKKRLKLTFE
jgi:hypothetical protein